MVYNVIITNKAKHHLESYINYTLNKLKNPQAAQSIIIDAKATKKDLSIVAASLPYCSNEILANLGYKIIHFKKHRFMMVYRVIGCYAIVDGMFHELQDYESILTQ